RIEALGRTHGLLSRENWGDVQLREICRESLEPYIMEDRSRVTFTGPPVPLKPKTALGLGMVFHELATNAIKHDALSNREGKVVVKWDLAEDDANRVQLHWGEEHGPEVSPPSRNGFGSRLIKLELTHELNGAVDLAYEKSGFRAVMTFPMDRDVRPLD